MDGAGAWAAFWRITLPLLAPSIAVVLILRTIEAFKVFDIIYVMTGGGPASGTQTVALLHLPAGVLQPALRLRGRRWRTSSSWPSSAWRCCTCGSFGRGRWQVSSEAQSPLPHRHPRGCGGHGPGDPAAVRVAAHLQHLPAHRPGVLARALVAVSPDDGEIPGHLHLLGGGRRQRRRELPPRHGQQPRRRGCTTAISLAVGALGGYAFARLRFRLRRTSLFAFLAIYMLPPIALVIPPVPGARQPRAAGQQDRADHHVLLHRHTVLPVDDEQLLPQPPADLEEAARVDGCSRLGALMRIILPLARPACSPPRCSASCWPGTSSSTP